LWSLLLAPTIIYAQVTQADYERAAKLRDKLQGMAVNVPERANWIGQTSRFWYRKSIKGGAEFMLVDAETLAKGPAFDHEKLAAALSAAANEKYEALKLPFQSITFVDNERALEFAAAGSMWRCNLSDYACKKTGAAPPNQFGFGRRGGGPEDNPEEPPQEFGNDVYDGIVDAAPQQGQRQGGQARGGFRGPGREEQEQNFKASPDGKWEALIQNFNVFIRPKGKTDATPLSWDGSEGNYYTLASIAWSPDSRRLAAYRVRPGYRREVHYIESSPADRLQPKHSTREYAKPGDALDVAQPALFEVETKKQVVVDNGMGTNNRSKAFHDVAWRNLGDAGFPDRILWHKAVAAKYPWYDITRVGVYGTSAGGQNSTGAVLFHPEFYKAAVSNSGCHDNRMDKIWWNEQWMGWPLGPHYAASSNVENASRLQGKLLLVVPEMDTNVDPASTWQVVNALIKANKKFDLLFVPGGGHGAGGAYYQRLLQDFFVHHLQGVEPPDWNKVEQNKAAAATGN